MDLLSLRPHIYKITKTTRWEVVLFHLFLTTTPTSNPKGGGGGHTLHAYSFSYWDTPTSGQKGGGACA